jgi:uncharacterized membrane protein
MTTTEPLDPIRYHVMMLSFRGMDDARRARDEVRLEGIMNAIEIEGEALVERDADGKIHVHESGAAGIGAVAGATTMGIVGVLTGPVVVMLLIALGGVIGGVAGHFAGKMLPPEDLRRVAAGLPPGSSAYLAVVDARHAPALAEAYAQRGAEVIEIPVETEVANAIREGIVHEVTRQ